MVSNSLGSITSSATTLTVNAASIAAAFTLHPSNQSVTAPAVATFTAAAVGTPTPTLQWQENASGSWSDIGGATASSYTTPATLVGDSGKQYRVMATNATANVTSNAARLTVSPAPVAPSFTTQPLSVTITAGQSTQFTVAASGTPTPALQWQLSTDNGTIWSNITGATGTVFNVINAAQGNNGRQFRAVASNGVGPEVNSTSAVLTVNPAATTGWQGNPTPLHADGIAYSPALAGNSAGQAIAMFFVLDNIYANRYGPTTGWEGRVPVSVNDPLYSQTDPQVAINGNGQAFAVWLKSGAGIGQVLAARFTPALGWGAPVTLSVNDSGGFAPQIAVDANGNAVAAWVQRASVFSAWQLFSMRFVAANESWEPARRIDSDAIGQPAGINPRVAINPAGEAFVLWAAPGSTLGSIALWATRMAATGVWGGALLVDEGPAVIPEQGLAVDANGNAMAVWKKMDNPRVPSIWSSRFDAVSGSWGSAVAVETSNLDRATSPQVAFDGSGQAVAVWVQYDGTLDHILSNRHTVAGGWGTPQSIASGAFNRLVEPSLAVNSGGTAVVAWRQAISYVAASIQAPGTAWRTPQLAPSTGSDGLTYSVSFPTVSAALDDNGNATIVWQGDRGASEYRIYSGRFR